MAVRNTTRRERRSWPELSKMDRELLGGARSFEAEDADSIPKMYHASPSDLRGVQGVSLHKILGACKEFGRGPQTPVRGHQHFTIAGRRATFTGAWDGPCPDVLARCGMLKASHDSARCYCCDVTFRALKADTCVWTLHRHVAPNCRHLQRARAQGIKTRNVRMFVRHFSTNDSMGLM